MTHMKNTHNWSDQSVPIFYYSLSSVVTVIVVFRKENQRACIERPMRALATCPLTARQYVRGDAVCLEQSWVYGNSWIPGGALPPTRGSTLVSKVPIASGGLLLGVLCTLKF